MKKLLLLPFIFIACNKGDEPKPSENKTENHVKPIYTWLLIKDNTNLTTNVYINSVRKSNIADTIHIKSGDKIQVVNVGVDTWSGSTKTDGYVSVQVILNDDTVFDANCTCDVLFNKVIQ